MPKTSPTEPAGRKCSPVRRWKQVAELDSPSTVAHDLSGDSVANWGSTAVTGATEHDVYAEGVYVLKVWIEVAFSHTLPRRDGQTLAKWQSRRAADRIATG